MMCICGKSHSSVRYTSFVPYRIQTPLLLTFLTLFSFFVYVQASYAASRPSAEVIQEMHEKAGCSSDPYAFLDNKQRHSAKGNPNSIVTPVTGDSGGLDVVFACRLTKLFEYIESQGCRITINSARRNKQVCGAAGSGCASQGNSCHQYGTAVDVGGPAKCLELVTSTIGRQNKNGRFGLHVAYVEKSPDYRHIQCVEHLVANASGGGCNTSCDGKTPINAGTSAGIDGRSPSSGLTNSLRQALGLNQQPQQPPPPPPIPQQQQAIPQQQQPTQYFPTQGTGSSGSGGTTGQSPVSALSPTSQQYLGVTGGGTQPTSIADQLLQIAYGTSTNQPQNTGTTVPLFLNPNDTGTLQAQPPAAPQPVKDQAQNDVPIGSLRPAQTFTSSDLAYSPSAQQNTLAPKPTGMYAVLEAMKQTLLRALEILRPMGIRAALTGEHTHENEHSE
jgi:hypothetical protein